MIRAITTTAGFSLIAQTVRLTICSTIIGLFANVALAVPSASATTLSLKEIRESGVVVQQWDTSCGAAAMATVLSYSFGDKVSEREVARGLLRQTEPLKVRYRGGFSMLDMKRYAEERGYRALGFRDLSIEDVRYFDAPIVPLNIHGYSHYVVFRGMNSAGTVHVADPAFGNRTLSRSKFEKAWINGMAFVMLKRAAQ